MTTPERPIAEGWNLFTVELLHAFPPGKTLRSLESFINAGVVQGLVDSLKYQGMFRVLNSRDLERVVQTYGLSHEQHRHLIAAIMATSIQQKLTQRLDNAKQGRAAAYAVIDIIESALVDAENAPQSPLGGLKNSPIYTLQTEPIQLALDAIDRGTTALCILDHMADGAPDMILVAREAYTEFTMALDYLEHTERTLPNWTYWHTEAQQGQLYAAEYGGK